MKYTFFYLLVINLFLLSGCSNIDYSHPLDSKGSFQHPEYFEVKDGDSIANYWNSKDSIFIANKDTTPPVLTLHGDLTVRIEQGDPDNLIERYMNDFDVSDNRDSEVKKGNAERVIVTNNIILYNPGEYYITYKAQDNVGNKISKTRTVIIYKPKAEDNIPPYIIFPYGDTTVINKGDPFNSLENVWAFDSGKVNDGDVTSRITVAGDVDVNKTGTYKLVYTVSDFSNNKSTKDRIIVVRDFQGNDNDWPVITLKGSDTMTIKQGEPFTDPGCSAYDSTEGDITAKVKTTTIPPLNASNPNAGQYIVNYEISDNAGHSVSANRILIVKGEITGDDVPPTLTLKTKKDSVTTITLGSKWTRPELIVYDEVDKQLTADKVQVSNPPNTAEVGTYTVTFTISDEAGNPAIPLKIKVIVVDTPKDVTAPVITILGDNPDTIGTGSTYNDKGAKAIDSADGDVSSKIKTSGEVKTEAGTYTITYTVQDLARNEAKAERTVVVMDGFTEKLLDKYGMPTSEPLPSVNKSFTSFATEGSDMPSLTAFKELTINWASGEWGGLHDFSISFTDNRNHISLTSSTKQTFKSAQPTLTLTGLNSKIPNFDGSYYVKIDGTSFIWVKTDGSCAIIWKP